MRYFLLPFLFIISLISCKKEISCNCYVSTAASGSIQVITVKSKKDKSSKQKACETEQVKRSTQTETWECSAQ